MRDTDKHQRQPGQVAVIMALAMTALLGATGIGVDLGFSYAHHRETQNAADAAALAGLQDVSRHYQYWAYTKGGSPPGTVSITADKTNSDVRSDMTKAAVSSLPNFPSAGSVTSLPAGIQLTAEYIRPDGTLVSVPTSGSITSSPPAATDPVGVKATVGYDYPTFFMRVFGIGSTHVQAEAFAKLFKGAPVDVDAPFVVCGTYSGSGAYWIGGPRAGDPQPTTPPPSSPSPPQIVTIVAGGQVNYNTWQSSWFLVHGAQLPQGLGTGQSTTPADCGHGASEWKGSTSQGSGCIPLSSASYVPCRQGVDNGNRAGPLRNRVNGMDGCDQAEANGCVVFLPIADGPLSQDMRVIDYAPFLVFPDNPQPQTVRVPGCNASNCHSGMLLPSGACGAGCVPSGAFDPSNPYGVTTFKLVQSASSSS
jgi:Flp pilus assembly protein TadG